jgi:hypothetical protein
MSGSLGAAGGRGDEPARIYSFGNGQSEYWRCPRCGDTWPDQSPLRRPVRSLNCVDLPAPTSPIYVKRGSESLLDCCTDLGIRISRFRCQAIEVQFMQDYAVASAVDQSLELTERGGIHVRR